MTFKYVLDYRDGEVFWCTADVGWVTGHSYIVYGPLANGATSAGRAHFMRWRFECSQNHVSGGEFSRGEKVLVAMKTGNR